MCTVNVRRAVVVVSWEKSLELYNAIAVCLLDSAQEMRVEVGFVVCVAVAVAYDARVDALVQLV